MVTGRWRLRLIVPPYTAHSPTPHPARTPGATGQASAAHPICTTAASRTNRLTNPCSDAVRCLLCDE